MVIIETCGDGYVEECGECGKTKTYSSSGNEEDVKKFIAAMLLIAILVSIAYTLIEFFLLDKFA